MKDTIFVSIQKHFIVVIIDGMKLQFLALVVFLKFEILMKKYMIFNIIHIIIHKRDMIHKRN
jgi:hypothetical protein